MTTKVLGAEQVARVIAALGLDAALDELIERLTHALAVYEPAKLLTPVRDGFGYELPVPGLLEWMPVMDVGRAIAVKAVGYHPGNPANRRQPTVLASISIYDPSTGRLLALLDATLLTAMRTGAASAVATDVLARDTPLVVGLVGCGAQAVTQLHAIARVRPVERALVTDTDPAVAASFARRASFVDRPIEVVPPADRGRLLAEADVLCTATSVDVGRGPVIHDGEHRPWLHVNAVGSDVPGKQELPDALLSRSVVCPDLLDQCLLEGELQRMGRGRAGPDLAALVQQRTRYEALRAQPTVFDSTGWALEDLVAADMVLEHATRLGLVSIVDVQAHPDDPYDPYRAVRR